MFRSIINHHLTSSFQILDQSIMQRTKTLAKIFKYPTYMGATEGQATIGKVLKRLADGLPNYYARSPGHFSKLRGILTHGARMSEFRCGTLVGEDKYGNRYRVVLLECRISGVKHGLYRSFLGKKRDFRSFVG